MNTAVPPVWLLDTNVISEGSRLKPDPQVLAMLVRHAVESALPATVWQEMRYGWLRMDDGKRKDDIARYMQEVAGRLPIIPYDAAAARIQAELRRETERIGRPIAFADSQIASIALARGLTLVSRNVKHFADVPGLRLVNWFQD